MGAVARPERAMAELPEELNRFSFRGSYLPSLSVAEAGEDLAAVRQSHRAGIGQVAPSLALEPCTEMVSPSFSEWRVSHCARARWAGELEVPVGHGAFFVFDVDVETARADWSIRPSSQRLSHRPVCWRRTRPANE